MKIVIIGRTSMLMNTAKLLLDNGFEIGAIITSPAAPEYSVTEDDYEELAKSLGVYYICTTKINSIVDELKSLKCDIGVSMNYSSTISNEIVNCFKLGILNAHLGDLPRYRGNATPNWAIINGEQNIPLCIQYMIGGELDSGDVLGKEYKKLDIQTKIGEVYDWVEEVTPTLYLEVLIKLKSDKNFILYKQSTNKNDIVRCYPRIPEDSKIDWSKTNIEIVRLINSSSKPFSGAFSFYNGQKIIFEDVEVCFDNEIYYAVPGQISEINKNEKYISIITGYGKVKVTKVFMDNIGYSPTEIVKSIRKRFIN
jgi:methionyl-tRNA formyltransferase